MPIYEYRCHNCGTQFEKMTTMAKADETPCKQCGSDDTERLLSVFGVSSSQKSSPCSDGACDLPPSCAGGQGCTTCPHAGAM